MTSIDWIIAGFTLLLAIYGYSQGFVVGALSLAGFGVGAVLGTRFGPALLPEGSESPYAPLFGLCGALIAGAIFAIGFEGLANALRRRIRWRAFTSLDGVLGALLTACVALGVAWIVSAVVLQVPGATGLRRDIQRSKVLRALNGTLPPSGPILNALARFDPFPKINGPRADVAPPTPAIGRDPQVKAASRSVVKVLGTACGLGIQGSGFVAAPGVVVTNAHVVAGEDDTTVQPEGQGDKLDARAVYFDPTNDLAVLRVDGLDKPSLRLTTTDRPGTATAVLGFPENGPYTVAPARLGGTQIFQTEDAYGRGPVRRSITSLRGTVRSGNSGGPLVDGAGRVAGTIFASTVGSAQPGGYAVPSEIVGSAVGVASQSSGDVGTGPCTR